MQRFSICTYCKTVTTISPLPYKVKSFFFLWWEILRFTLLATFKYALQYYRLQSPCCSTVLVSTVITPGRDSWLGRVCPSCPPQCGSSLFRPKRRRSVSQCLVFLRGRCPMWSCKLSVLVEGGEFKILLRTTLNQNLPVVLQKSISRFSNSTHTFPKKDLCERAAVFTNSPFLTSLKINHGLTPQLQCKNHQGAKKGGEYFLF